MAEKGDDPAFPPSGGGKKLPLIELETMLNWPPTRRKRLAQVGLMLVAVVVLVIFWGSVASGRQTTLRSGPMTLTPVLLIYGNTNYGTVTLNGKKQSGQIPLLIGLPAEPSYTFDITLDAPPFLPQSCHVSFPGNGYANGDNNCHAAQNTGTGSMTINGETVLPAFEVDFSLMLSDLPSEQQNKVVATLNQTLTYQQDLTVPAGSYFATGVESSGKIAS